MDHLVTALMRHTVLRVAPAIVQADVFARTQGVVGLIVVVLTTMSAAFGAADAVYLTRIRLIGRAAVAAVVGAAVVGLDPGPILAALDQGPAATATILVLTDLGSGLFRVPHDAATVDQIA